MNTEKKKEIVNKWAEILGTMCGWFISATFIMWGWNVIAPHLNCPLFSYWEIFAVRMALGSIATMFHSKKN